MNQRRYLSNVLERFEMSNCKPRATPSEQKLEFGSEHLVIPEVIVKLLVVWFMLWHVPDQAYVEW